MRREQDAMQRYANRNAADRLRSVRHRRNAMTRKIMLALARAAILAPALVATNASAEHRHWYGYGGYDRDIRSDRRDIFRDRRDIGEDRRDIARDRADLARDLRYGASRADIARDWADIRRDRRDLRGDFRDIRRDRRDLREDRWDRY